MTQWRLRLSAYDKHVHAFGPEQQEGMWEAACKHSVPVNFMAECPDDVPTCTSCVIEFASALAARQEDRNAAIAAANQAEFNRSTQRA